MAKSDQGTGLLVISSAPGRMRDGLLTLDKKFVEGMRLYSSAWPGWTACLLRQRDDDLPFAGRFDPSDLPFDVRLRPAQHRIEAEDLKDYGVVLCSGDNADYLHLARLGGTLGKAVHFTIEYIPETRRQIVMLDPSKSLPAKVKSLLSIQYHERRRRRAFRLAAGLQANGYPAAARYRTFNPETLLYLDNRMDDDLLATEAEMAARGKHLLTGGPLRLIHSGRLEPMKGSQDLVPIARRLRGRGVDFVLDIFGQGSLEPQIRREIAEQGLGAQVRLHGSVDFASELVPYARRNADIYLSCHRQSDPSCSYLENMGCGLAVAGYANRMWQALSQDSGAGWVAATGDPVALADRIVSASGHRGDILTCCENARRFAASHLFRAEFDKRVRQLQSDITASHLGQKGRKVRI